MELWATKKIIYFTSTKNIPNKKYLYKGTIIAAYQWANESEFKGDLNP